MHRFNSGWGGWLGGGVFVGGKVATKMRHEFLEYLCVNMNGLKFMVDVHRKNIPYMEQRGG